MPLYKRCQIAPMLAVFLVSVPIAYVAFAGSNRIGTTNPDKALVHRNLAEDPYVPRLTLAATRANYDRDLFGNVRGSMQVFYQHSVGTPLKQTSITLDHWWNRIVHTQNFETVAAWGNSDPNPRLNLRIPLAIVANTGYWIVQNDRVSVFIAEMGPPRILRAFYDFGAQNMNFSESLSVAGDSLEFPRDVDLADNGTPGYVYDDTLWVLDDDPMAPRLVGYLSEWHGPAKAATIMIPYGSGPGQINYLRNFAMGRDLSGANTKEVYLTDGAGKIVQFRISGGALVYENEYLFGWSGGQQQEIADPLDIAVDSYGQVYIAVQGPSSRIYKFTPDLQLLDVFNREGKGPDEIWRPRCLMNSRPTAGYAGFDNLLVTEDWSTETGGQRYAIGVKDSLVARVAAPHYSEVTYHATDPHNLTLQVDRWSGSAWLLYATDSLGYKWSGQTHVRWDLPHSAWGINRSYRFRHVSTSTYDPFQSGQLPFADTIEYVVTMGNERPRIITPIVVDGLNGGCMVRSFGDHTAWVEVVDDAPLLTYDWSEITGQAQFYDSSSQSWVSQLSGSQSSVAVCVPGSVGALEALPPYVSLKVIVTDLNSSAVSVVSSYGTCDPDLGNCDCTTPCFCPLQGDPNGDGALDVFDTVLLIEIVFSGEAPAPPSPLCPTSREDVNNDLTVDVFDLIYLIDYVFSGGPPPADPCGL